MKLHAMRLTALLLITALLLPGPEAVRAASSVGSIGQLAGLLSAETEPAEPAQPEAGDWSFPGEKEKSVDQTPEDSALLPQRAQREEEEPGLRLYFGQLHAHTGDSDGTGTPADAYENAAAAGLDFFAVTDHSNSFDGAELGSLTEEGGLVSEKWRLGKTAAADACSEDFLAIYGFELSWQNGLGHIGTFFTPGFLSRKHPLLQDYATALEIYYNRLTAVPGAVGQFNHPGSFYGDFEDFGHYSREADAVMQLLEVSCEGEDSLESYFRALDKGWHLAPVISENTHGDPWEETEGRTVVLADALTEEAFALALQNRRVYATEDRNLKIRYTLDGHDPGTVLHRRSVGETVTLRASLSDPDGEAIGMVEVLTEGGTVAAAREIAESSAEPEFTLPANRGYYLLRITQPDGDVALTAPVWIEQAPQAQILSFTADTALAVSGRPLTLRAEIGNRDPRELKLETVTVSVGERVLHTFADPGSVPGDGTLLLKAELTLEAVGLTELRLDVRGSVDGEPVSCTAVLSLTFLTEDLVTDIVADGSHGMLPSLTELEALAAENRMALHIADRLTPEVLASCDVLLIPAPTEPPEAEYRKLIRSFAASGRTIVLWGAGDRENPEGTEGLNDLAAELGLTARFRDDTVFDPVNNGGCLDEVLTDVYNKEDAFSAGLSGYWTQSRGCTLDPGSGTWLVKGMTTAFSVDGDRDGLGCIGETFAEVAEGMDVIHNLVVPRGEAVLLIREETTFGGSVFLSGGAFVSDGVLDAGGANPWDAPNGNALAAEAVLNITRDTLAVISISRAKQAGEGETVRIRGHITAGTAVPGNAFPGMLYVQDETGGLGISGAEIPGISLGAPVELYLRREGNTFLLLHLEILTEPYYNYLPAALSCADALRHDRYGDLLVQVEGRVTERTLTEGGRGIRAFTLEDREGNRVTVRIEDTIRSGSTGENTLAETVEVGAWVKTVGFVYLNEGQTGIRVRNCDEITAIRETGKTYRVVKGEYTVWIKKNGKSVYMEVEGPAEEFLGVHVDGEPISRSHYQTTLTETGNLLFRFWPRYLRTLELGEHTLTFRFRDGEAEATLVVWNHADSPYTGDPVLLYGAMMILSGGLLRKMKRRR